MEAELVELDFFNNKVREYRTASDIEADESKTYLYTPDIAKIMNYSNLPNILAGVNDEHLKTSSELIVVGGRKNARWITIDGAKILVSKSRNPDKKLILQWLDRIIKN